MKRNLPFIVSLICCTLLLNVIKAQNTPVIPNNSFENWSTGQGYNVTVLFFQLPVYSSYPYPSSWNYLAYPVNETLSYSGMSVNVNTNIPLIKVSQETTGIPDGSKALKMETFMLSDIISSTVYSLAASSLDPELTSLVVPSVLATCDIKAENMMSLADIIMDNIDNPSQLIAVLHNEDLSNYIIGGIAIDSVVPDRLTGSYKYTSASNNGDNGGVVMIGTKYNPVTHRREAVGGGYNISLTDTASYTDFEVVYQSLHEMNPQYEEVAPDSLVILLVSSANNHRQQGSALYLDNLQLLKDTVVEPEIPVVPDTCNEILQLTVTAIDTCNATLSWNNEEVPAAWQYAYGIEGFALDNVEPATIADSTLTLHDLLPGTTYDCYVRAQCNDTLFSNWSMASFTTDTLVPPTPPTPPIDTTGIHLFNMAGLHLFPNPAHGQVSVVSEQTIPTVIRIFNVEGKLLETLYPTSDKTIITLSTTGIYIIEAEVAGRRFSQKVLNR